MQRVVVAAVVVANATWSFSGIESIKSVLARQPGVKLISLYFTVFLTSMLRSCCIARSLCWHAFLRPTEHCTSKGMQFCKMWLQLQFFGFVHANDRLHWCKKVQRLEQSWWVNEIRTLNHGWLWKVRFHWVPLEKREFSFEGNPRSFLSNENCRNPKILEPCGRDTPNSTRPLKS